MQRKLFQCVRMQVRAVGGLEVLLAQSVELYQVAFEVVAPVEYSLAVAGVAFAFSRKAVDVESVFAFRKCFQGVLQPAECLPVLPIVLLEHLDAGWVTEYKCTVGSSAGAFVTHCLCVHGRAKGKDCRQANEYSPFHQYAGIVSSFILPRLSVSVHNKGVNYCQLYP